MPFVIAVLFFVSITPSWADFEKGVEAYKKEDYASAMLEWRPLAEKGDPDAQFNIGLMYHDGQGIERDREESARWFRKAEEGYRHSADNGDAYAYAHYALGFMYEMGLGVQVNDEASKHRENRDTSQL